MFLFFFLPPCVNLESRVPMKEKKVCTIAPLTPWGKNPTEERKKSPLLCLLLEKTNFVVAAERWEPPSSAPF